MLDKVIISVVDAASELLYKYVWLYYNEKPIWLDPQALTLWFSVAQAKGAHLDVCSAVIYMALVTVYLTGCLGAQIKKNTFNNNGLGAYSFE